MTSHLPTIAAAPLTAKDMSTPRSQRRRRTVALRLVASVALVASSAFVLLSSSSSEGGEEWGLDMLRSTTVGGFGRNLSEKEPLLTNLAVLSGTTTAAEAVARAKSEGDEEERAKGVTPVYWHIYKAGGTSVKNMLSFCLDLTVASNFGVLKGHDKDETIGIMRAGGHKYVNVDTISFAGIERAARLGLAESGLADVVESPPIFKTINTVFSPQHKGMLFTVFRHPVDRLVSQYYYLQYAQWEATYNPDISKKTLGEYAKIYSNRMIRQLVGKDVAGGKITEADLELAKEVVRTRMIVGLLSDEEGSVKRFVEYFGWKRRDGKGDEYERCEAELFDTKKKAHGSRTDGNSHKHPKIEEGTEAWNDVAKWNEFDIKLYEYAVEVYEEQGKFLGVKPAATVS